MTHDRYTLESGRNSAGALTAENSHYTVICPKATAAEKAAA
jgi:hypothetical protein